MKKPALLFCLIAPPLLAAAQPNLTSTGVLIYFYLYLVVPVAVLMANVVMAIIVLFGGRVRSSVFQTITTLNLLLVALAIAALWDDVHDSTKAFDDLLPISMLTIFVPLTASVLAIVKRKIMRPDDQA